MTTTDTARDDLHRLIENAAATWDAYATARDRVTAAWHTLQDTPAPLFPARTLALLDAHDHAMTAAATWDTVAARLASVVPITRDDGTLVTWDEAADIIGIDTAGWVVSTDPHDYSPHLARGPLAERDHLIHRGRLDHLATVRDLATMGDTR